MKIVTREQLMKMPEGTLFQNYNTDDLTMEEAILSVFHGATCGGEDFVRSALIGFDSPPARECVLVYEDIARSALALDGEDFPVSTGETMRDGLFEDEALYVVFSGADVQELIKALTNALPN